MGYVLQETRAHASRFFVAPLNVLCVVIVVACGLVFVVFKPYDPSRVLTDWAAAFAPAIALFMCLGLYRLATVGTFDSAPYAIAAIALYLPPVVFATCSGFLAGLSSGLRMPAMIVFALFWSVCFLGILFLPSGFQAFNIMRNSLYEAFFVAPLDAGSINAGGISASTLQQVASYDSERKFFQGFDLVFLLTASLLFAGVYAIDGALGMSQTVLSLSRFRTPYVRRLLLISVSMAIVLCIEVAQWSRPLDAGFFELFTVGMVPMLFMGASAFVLGMVFKNEAATCAFLAGSWAALQLPAVQRAFTDSGLCWLFPFPASAGGLAMAPSWLYVLVAAILIFIGFRLLGNPEKLSD